MCELSKPMHLTIKNISKYLSIDDIRNGLKKLNSINSDRLKLNNGKFTQFAHNRKHHPKFNFVLQLEHEAFSLKLRMIESY